MIFLNSKMYLERIFTLKIYFYGKIALENFLQKMHWK